jgi:ankyrin repeat protein
MRKTFLAACLLLAAGQSLADANGDLFAASLSGDVGALSGALARGADANATDEHGLTALMYCAAVGKPEAVRTLLDARANANAHAAQDGITALDIALDRQQWQAAELLLAQGASLADSATGKERALRKLLDLQPVLHPRTMTLVQTVELPGPGLFRAMLAQGANTAYTDAQGNSLLLLAAKRHHVTALEALVAAGADVSARNAEGDTALAIAAGKSEYELMVIGVGLALGQDRNSLMRLVFRPAPKSDESASTERRLQAARVLLSAKADPNAADGSGNTPLLEATRSGDAELVGMLIAAGARVDARNSAGATPLLLAAQFGLHEIASELLAARADIAVRDSQGRGVLELAQAGGHEKVVQLLEKATAN